MAISRDQLVALADQEPKHEPVTVDALGGKVYIREMTGAEMDEYQNSLFRRENGRLVQDFSNSTAKLVARCLYDGNGDRMFDPGKDAEVATVGRLPNRVLEPLERKARQINGLSAEESEEMGKNSSEDSSGGSSSS